MTIVFSNVAAAPPTLLTIDCNLSRSLHCCVSGARDALDQALVRRLPQTIDLFFPPGNQHPPNFPCSSPACTLCTSVLLTRRSQQCSQWKRGQTRAETKSGGAQGTKYYQVRFIFNKIWVTSEPFQCRGKDPVDDGNPR